MRRFRASFGDGKQREKGLRPAAFPVLGPTLSRFGRDLTSLALAARPIVGREAETAMVFEVLLRWRHNNAVIVGRPGAGKTTLLIEAARQMALGTAPSGLAGRAMVELSMRSLITGASVRGQIEDRAAAVLRELRSYHGALIAVFDDLSALVTDSATGGVDVLRLLWPALESSETPTVATTDDRTLQDHAELARLVEAQFQIVPLAEPEHAQALRMLQLWTSDLEAHHSVTFASTAVEHAAHLARRYLKPRALPDSALSLLDQAAASVHLSAVGPTTVEPTHVAAIAARWTGIPLQQLLDEEATRLSHLEDVLHRRVVGQEPAVAAVANAVRRARVQLADPRRPVGTFLFLGPTGVGKTELARALAELLFQDEASLVRIDMSEFMERHQIARLIGAPPGYVGYGEGGQLTNAVLQRPYCIVLLDELEKAHPDVFNLLLQIMEDGRLTDGLGQTIDFRHTVIVMTSNCGSEHIVELSDASEADVHERVMRDVQAQFKPEFLNRIDEIIVFHRLTREEIRRVVDIQARRLHERLRENGIELLLTDLARDWLAARGYDIEYGARPLKRLMRRELEDTIASAIVRGEMPAGGGVVRVDAPAAAGDDGHLVIQVEPVTQVGDVEGTLGNAPSA